MTAYAAFVDVGVCKDGLYHVSEAQWFIGAHVPDLREWLSVGDRLEALPLYVRDVDEVKERFTLTSRPPRDAAGRQGATGRESSARNGAVSEGEGVKRVGGGAQRDSAELTRPAGRASDTTGFPPLLSDVVVTGGEVAVAAKGAEAGRHADASVGSEAIVVEPSMPTEPLVPTAAAILRGVEASAPPPAPALREVARVQIRGVVHVLYEIPH